MTNQWPIGKASKMIILLHSTDLEMVATYLSVVGKGFVGAGFVGMYSFTAELSPTIIRNMAVSYGSACARVGGMVAPYVGGPLVSTQME